MTRAVFRLALVGYLAAWLVAGVAAAYFVMAAGYPWWLGAGIAFLLFFFVNGAVGYREHVRQQRERGQQPRQFVAYLFYPTPFASNVPLPRPLRVVLGIAFLLAGAAFVALAILLVAATDPEKIRVAIGGALFAALGLGIAYVGWRLTVVKNDERLLGRPRIGAAP